jgi:hypothetical protein
MTPPRNLKSRIDHLLQEAFVNDESHIYWIVSNVIVLVILWSIVVVLLDYEPLLKPSEYIVATVFILEYAANIYVTKPARRYIFSVRGGIDLLAIAPTLLVWLDIPQLKVVRGLRMARFVRILRFLRLVRLLKLTEAARGDVRRLAGVAFLGIGVVIIAVCRGVLIGLDPAVLRPIVIVGFAFVGVGDLIYVSTFLRRRPVRGEPTPPGDAPS